VKDTFGGTLAATSRCIDVTQHTSTQPTIGHPPHMATGRTETEPDRMSAFYPMPPGRMPYSPPRLCPTETIVLFPVSCSLFVWSLCCLTNFFFAVRSHGVTKILAIWSIQLVQRPPSIGIYVAGFRVFSYLPPIGGLPAETCSFGSLLIFFALWLRYFYPPSFLPPACVTRFLVFLSQLKRATKHCDKNQW